MSESIPQGSRLQVRFPLWDRVEGGTRTAIPPDTIASLAVVVTRPDGTTVPGVTLELDEDGVPVWNAGVGVATGQVGIYQAQGDADGWLSKGRVTWRVVAT